jgi:hypothetical protein
VGERPAEEWICHGYSKLWCCGHESSVQDEEPAKMKRGKFDPNEFDLHKDAFSLIFYCNCLEYQCKSLCAMLLRHRQSNLQWMKKKGCTSSYWWEDTSLNSTTRQSTTTNSKPF